MQQHSSSTRIGWLAAAAAATLTALAISACGGGSGTTAPPTTASGKPATVGLAGEGNLGEILVDTQGRSLYLFQKDIGTRSECTGACAAAWPPLGDAGKPLVGANLSASKSERPHGPTASYRSPTTDTRSTCTRATTSLATPTARGSTCSEAGGSRCPPPETWFPGRARAAAVATDALPRRPLRR
jgi:hypothetical protein